jgi:Xaa-Pro aminopeptidase
MEHYNTINKIRNFLTKNNIQAIVIPNSDSHKNEYIEDYWKVCQFVSNFTGSACTVVISQTHAGLWTDSRYFIQAEKQIPDFFTLHKIEPNSQSLDDWLLENIKAGQSVGITPQLFSASEVAGLKKKLNPKDINITLIDDISIDIWSDRPELSKNKIFIHDDKFNEFTRVEKIKKVTDHLTSENTDYILISALDDIAWLLNLRGADIKYNPLFYSYVLINNKQVSLFIDKDKITPQVNDILTNNSVKIYDYYEIKKHLSEIKNSTIEIDEKTINYDLLSAINTNCKIQYKNSFISKEKTKKGKKEIENYRNAQIKDGVAMCNLLYWLDNNINKNSITETDVALMAENYRSEQNDYIGLSFNTISAYQENAALPHYSPNTDTPILLKPKGIYLIDSGAQYLDGTTDITRTIALGNITDEQKTNFTLVLKGHIRLASAKFPYGTKGYHLDTLARYDLWNNNKDYGHGTGHGIGYFLNVHEGPVGFSQTNNKNSNTVIEPGMFISNEPGFYLENEYGIRIENVLICIKDETSNFLKFETVTLCPIDTNLIDNTILTKDEIDWVNNYHKKVYDTLSAKVSLEVFDWLSEKTMPL